MSIRRFVATTAVMAGIAVVLSVLTPRPAALIAALSAPQDLADALGPDAVVLCGVGLLAWIAWGWGALGLVLTAGSALPGAAGAVARLGLRVVLPAGARRAAALALGVGMTVGTAGTALAAPPPTGSASGAPTSSAAPAPVAAPGPAPLWSGGKALGTTAPPGSPTAVPGTTPVAVPDWPTGAERSGHPATASAPGPARSAVPDWATDPVHAGVPDRRPGSAAPSAGPAQHDPAGHTVVPGDCLWTIAAGWLRDATGRIPTDPEVAAAVRSWWAANRTVIGSDPDLLLPGQVLRPPPQP